MPTAFHVAVDNASSTVTAPRAAGSATVQVAAGAVFGAAFPLYLAVDRGGAPLTILEVTGRAGNLLTVAGPASARWPDADLQVGDTVEVRPVAEGDAEIKAAINALEAAPGDLHYAFLQPVPAASWTIVHGLGKYPSVSVADSGGSWVVGDVTYLDPDRLTIDFLAAFSGVAYLN